MFESKRIQRYMEITKKIALTSEFKTFKHGAILVKGGNIFSQSCNKYNYSRFCNKFKCRPGNVTIHAELGTILGIDKSVTTNATIYVCRIGVDNTFRLSKPCNMCQECARYVGISKIVYSINDSQVGILKL